MKVSQLDMGCSHIAVLLTKDDILIKNTYIKKEEKEKEEIMEIKPIKRKSEHDNENENDNKENDKDKDEKVKALYIREEFITLNVRDKPKIFKILNKK